MGAGREYFYRYDVAVSLGPCLIILPDSVEVTSFMDVFVDHMKTQQSFRFVEWRKLLYFYPRLLVEGALHPDAGTVDAAIAKFSKQRPLRHLDPEGREAITDWRVIERTNYTTRVELTPKTGRSHQLRLHMQSLGHPILGDVFYGDPRSHERLCLHATVLSFDHPATDEKLMLSAPVPF